MVSDTLKNATRLQRKASIRNSERTGSRDEVADWIEEHAADDWNEWTMTDIAEEVGYSRQHVANTVEAYFEPVDREGNSIGGKLQQGSNPENESPLHALSQRELEIYRMGYRDGWRDRNESL